MNLKFIAHKMLCPKESTIKEKENELFPFTHIAEALDNFHKLTIGAGLDPLKHCLKTVNTDSEPKGHSLASTACSVLLVRESFHEKLPLDYLNMYILDELQMTSFEWRDPYLSQKSSLNPPTCQDLICQMNFYIK